MLKKSIVVLFTCYLNICLIPFVHAQDDADGCKDHTLFNRMPNYHITNCAELEFSSMKFPVGPPNPNNDNKMKMERVEGKIIVLNYYLKIQNEKK